MRVIFFGKYSKFNKKFKNAEKIKKISLILEIIAYELVPLKFLY